MLATHFLSKNIKTQVILPFQWLIVTIRAIKTNSLLLDSNKDSDSSNRTKKNIDYLDKAEKLHKRKLIGSKLTKTATTLTSSRINPNEKILDTLLTDISNIQDKGTVNALNKINRHNENIIRKRYLKDLRAKQNLMNINDKAVERKYERNDKLPLIQTLVKKQKNRMDHHIVNNKYEQATHKNEPSMIRARQRYHRNMNDNIKTNYKQNISSDRHENNTQGGQQKKKYTYKITQNPIIPSEKEIIFLRNREIFKLDTIFSNEFTEPPDVPQLNTWHACEAMELQLTTYPKNAFEEMIQWTEEGKLWKFPIDNEQDMKIEQNVHFSRHVFLERHLAEWCPTKGPIRHFMELVCVGLSKNPYMTVQEKEDHLMWYKNYFNDKKDLLQELGLIE